MSRFRRFLLWILEAIDRRVSRPLKFLREQRELADLEALRGERGGWPNGAWVRIEKIDCDKCRNDHPVGAVRRIKRFTTEAAGYGEWVFDRPRTAFCCSLGVVFSRATPEAIAEALVKNGDDADAIVKGIWRPES